MDRYKNEIERLKSGKFARTYHEATGVNYHEHTRPDKFPWGILFFLVIILIALL